MLKRLVVASLTVAVLALAGNASAVPNTVRIFDAPGIGTTSGGAFWADLSKTGNGNDFLTFCLEKDETISLGTSYNYTVDTAAINGGMNVDGVGSDPLDSRTAYLFSQFLNGSLGVKTDTLGNDVQTAIWYLEEEYTNKPNAYNALSTIAKSYVDTYVEPYKNSGRFFGISVMNLTDRTTGEVKQSMLYVPEPGMILLLGSGLLGLGLLRRKVKQV